MPDDISGFLSLALAIVSVATLAGLGLTRGTVTNLRESLADARGDIASLKSDRTDDRATIETQKGELETLKRLVTGEVHWIAITDLLETHHSEAVAFWRTAETTIGEAVAALHRIENHP